MFVSSMGWKRVRLSPLVHDRITPKISRHTGFRGYLVTSLCAGRILVNVKFAVSLLQGTVYNMFCNNLCWNTAQALHTRPKRTQEEILNPTQSWIFCPAPSQPTLHLTIVRTYTTTHIFIFLVEESHLTILTEMEEQQNVLSMKKSIKHKVSFILW
mgnify:CR=1 FL=1